MSDAKATRRVTFRRPAPPDETPRVRPPAPPTDDRPTMRPRAPHEYNPEAFGAHILAEEAYLRENGWTAPNGREWYHLGKMGPVGSHTMTKRNGIDRSHAVNAQKQFDARCAAWIASQVAK